MRRPAFPTIPRPLKMPFHFRFIAILLSLVVGGRSVLADEAANSWAAMRVLKTQCFGCHSEKKRKGGLVMTSREALIKGGDNGTALVPGDPEKSEFLATLSAEADPHMPPKKQLASPEIAALRAWVVAGAPWEPAALVEPAREVVVAALPESYQPAFALALSPDGTRLAVSRGAEVVLLQIGEKAFTVIARASAQIDAVQCIAWSSDGQHLATGSFRRVLLWNAPGLLLEREVLAGLTGTINTLAFLPGDRQLIIADGRQGEDGFARVVDLADGAVTAAWPAHEDAIADLAISTDGRLLATAGGDGLVKLWELATRQEILRIEAHSSQALSLAFNADATQLVTGGTDRQLSVWDAKTRDRLIALGKPAAPITAVAWAAGNGAIFTATDAGQVMRYTELKPHTGAQSSDSAQEKKYESADDTLYALAASADGTRVFASTHDGRVLEWNNDGKLIQRFSLREAADKTVAAK